MFNHPGYKLYRDLICFHLRQELKTGLEGQRFHPNKKLEDTLEIYFKTLAATFYEDDIEKLAHQYTGGN